jgi:hypothetical protein
MVNLRVDYIIYEKGTDLIFPQALGDRNRYKK